VFQGRFHPLTPTKWFVLASLAACLAPSPARSVDKLCFPGATGAPDWSGQFKAFPTIDGVIDNPYDPGWTGAFRYSFQNGTSAPFGWIQGLRTTQAIYLGLVVSQFDRSIDLDDAIVVGLRTQSASQETYHKVSIQPFLASGSTGTNLAARQVYYWRGTRQVGASSIVWQPLPISNPPAVTAKYSATASGNPAVCSSPASATWTVELKLDLTLVPDIVAGQDFSFMVATFPVNAPGCGQVPPLEWPMGLGDFPVGFDAALDSGLPDAATWGTANLGSGCTGVYFASQDIKTGNVPDSYINPNAGNSFSVIAHNSALQAVPLGSLEAHFRIANFGINDPIHNAWQELPRMNPAPQANDLPASQPPPIAGQPRIDGATTLTAGPWTPSSTTNMVGVTPPITEAAYYAAHDHQCILVDLKPQVSGVTLVNATSWRNMDFTLNPGFVRQAEVDVSKYRERAGGQGVQRLYLASRPNYHFGLADGVSTPITKGRLVAQLSWLVHGFRATGHQMKVNGHFYEVVDPIGSFGYVVQHDLKGYKLPAAATALTEATLTKMDAGARAPAAPDRMAVLAAPEGVSRAVDDFKPVWSMSFQGSSPLADKEGVYVMDVPDGGKASLALTAEYKAPPCGCGFPRTSGPCLGLVAFGLVAFAPRSRRREP
jgi:hypothetical protein